jgi:hypothetical protein
VCHGHSRPGRRPPPTPTLPYLSGSGDADDEPEPPRLDRPDADWPKGWHRSNPLPAEGASGTSKGQDRQAGPPSYYPQPSILTNGHSAIEHAGGPPSPLPAFDWPADEDLDLADCPEAIPAYRAAYEIAQASAGANVPGPGRTARDFAREFRRLVGEADRLAEFGHPRKAAIALGLLHARQGRDPAW